MSSGHLPRYHVQEVAEAHTASTARKLDARILRSIPRTLGPRGLEGPLLTPTASWKSLRLRATCPQPQSFSSSHTPRSCFPESACLLSCFASVSIARPRVVNYKSGFSTVSSSQPGSGPSFSFVNEAKTGLFPGFVSCNAPPSPHPSLRTPSCAFHLTLLRRGQKTRSRHNWVFGLFPPLLQSVWRCGRRE